MSFLFPSGSSEPNLVIPQAKTPQVFQTIIPKKSYQDLAESVQRTEGEYNRLLDQRYDMTGTGADIGARQRGIEMQEAASYRSSLPTGNADQSFRGTPREFDIKSKGNTFETKEGQSPNTPAASTASTTPPKLQESRTTAQEAADLRYGNAKENYLAAVEKAKTTPRSFKPITENPGYANTDSSIYLPKKNILKEIIDGKKDK